jgi:hypothetical protein
MAYTISHTHVKLVIVLFNCLFTFNYFEDKYGLVRFMVFNATFNNISVISWRSVLLVEETGENHRPVAGH